MANSKVFRNAQNRSAGMGSSKDGYYGFSDAVKAIKKTQTKKCEPYKFLLEISKKIKVSRKNLYFKILFSNNRGQIKLMVAVGKNKDRASSGKSFFVLGNILSEKIDSMIPINKEISRKATQEKNKSEKDRLGAPSTATRRRKSVRFRKKRRKIPRRAKLVRNRRRVKPLKDKIVLKDFNESGAPIPQQFNTPDAAVPPKDFASIFEDANNKLYNEDQNNDIQVDNPPGVAKFIGLGVDIDRPSVIASTDISPIIYDDSLDVYEQVLLDKKFRLETVYRNLQKVETEDVEKLLETYQEYVNLTEDSLISTAVISSLDEELVERISTDMLDIANILGFDTSLKLSQIYLQVLNDLGEAPTAGTYDTQRGVRKTSIKDNDLNIDENYSRHGIRTGSFRFLNNKFDARHFVGDFGTLLGYYNQTDPLELRQSGKNQSLGNPGIHMRSVYSLQESVLVLNMLYNELVLSKLLTSGDSNAKFLKDNGYRNIIRSFLGEFSDPRKSLNDVKVPEQLAGIVKFNNAGENYFPLEQFISAGSGIKGRTFLDSIVQPAIGSLIEETDPNFDLLNLWSEQSRNSLDSFFKYIDASSLDGGAAIMVNEMVLTLLKCISDPQAKISSKKHPKSSQMLLKNNNLTPANVAGILQRFFSEARNQRGPAHIYNTLGYCFFEGQSSLANNLGGNSFTGLYEQSISRKTREYGIGYGNNWKFNATRSINDGEPVSRILNNGYEEASRFFQMLENNIMTSVDLLLADSGLISLSETPSYNSLSSGFLVEKPSPPGKRVVNGFGSNKGSKYEETAFSGIPKIHLRLLLARCCFWILNRNNYLYRYSLGRDDAAQALLKAAKVAVENTDPELGPVRWKVTHGQWPPESETVSDLTVEDYNKFVPEEVRLAREGEVDVDIETNNSGTPTSVSVNDPAEGWEFIDGVEGFCPLTLMIDGEDDSEKNFSLVKGNRSIFDDVFDEVVQHRSRIYKMKQFLEMPLTAYQNFPEKLEDSVGKLSLDSLKALAQLPGIDGQEIVKFTSPNQINNMKVSMKLETASKQLRYLPNKYAISDREYLVARKFIDDYMQKEFSDQEKTVVHSVGIPSGLLAAEKVSKEPFSLTREAEYMFFPQTSWSPKLKKFHPSIYMIPGSFNSCDQDSSYSSIVQKAKYFIATDSVAAMMSYSEAREALGLNNNQAIEIFTNHCIDHSLKLALKITTGADFSEDTFRIGSGVNNLYVSPDGQKNVESLLEAFPENYSSIFKDDGVDKVQNIIKSLEDSTVLEVNNFLASLDCRLISTEDVSRKVLGPRVFDRVFNMFVHPDEHYSSRSYTGIKRVRKKIDGKTKVVYQINLAERGSNSIKNDHFASYYYKVEKL